MKLIKSNPYYKKGIQRVKVRQRADLTRRFNVTGLLTASMLHLDKDEFERRTDRGVSIEGAYIIGAVRKEHSFRKYVDKFSVKGQRPAERVGVIFYVKPEKQRYMTPDGTIDVKHVSQMLEKNILGYQPIAKETA